MAELTLVFSLMQLYSVHLSTQNPLPGNGPVRSVGVEQDRKKTTSNNSISTILTQVTHSSAFLHRNHIKRKKKLNKGRLTNFMKEKLDVFSSSIFKAINLKV